MGKLTANWCQANNWHISEINSPMLVMCIHAIHKQNSGIFFILQS